jgi:hypothetical protein
VALSRLLFPDSRKIPALAVRSELLAYELSLELAAFSSSNTALKGKFQLLQQQERQEQPTLLLLLSMSRSRLKPSSAGLLGLYCYSLCSCSTPEANQIVATEFRSWVPRP